MEYYAKKKRGSVVQSCSATVADVVVRWVGNTSMELKNSAGFAYHTELCSIFSVVDSEVYCCVCSVVHSEVYCCVCCVVE